MKQLARVWELEAWSPPGLQLNLEYAKSELAPAMWDAGISRDIFIGLSEVPDPVDCNNLKADINDGRLTIEAFSAFCAQRDLIDSLDDKHSAARFREFIYGRALAWVHIPDNESAPSLAANIDKLIRIKGFHLIEPLTGRAWDLIPGLGPNVPHLKTL